MEEKTLSLSLSLSLSDGHGLLATQSAVCHVSWMTVLDLFMRTLKANSAALKYSALMAEARRLQMQAIIASASTCVCAFIPVQGACNATYLRDLTQQRTKNTSRIICLDDACQDPSRHTRLSPLTFSYHIFYFTRLYSMNEKCSYAIRETSV